MGYENGKSYAENSVNGPRGATDILQMTEEEEQLRQQPAENVPMPQDGAEAAQAGAAEALAGAAGGDGQNEDIVT